MVEIKLDAFQRLNNQTLLAHTWIPSNFDFDKTMEEQVVPNQLPRALTNRHKEVPNDSESEKAQLETSGSGKAVGNSENRLTYHLHQRSGTCSSHAVLRTFN